MLLRLTGAVCQTQRVLIGLFPELDAPGGIQRAGRHMAFVMSEFASSQKMEYRLLSLNDTQELHRMRVVTMSMYIPERRAGKRDSCCLRSKPRVERRN